MTRYYAQKSYYKAEGNYTNNVETLKQYSTEPFTISNDAEMTIDLIDGGFEASATLLSYTAKVNQERYLVVSAQKRDIPMTGVATDL
jgi:hypothetical protein